MRTLVTGASGQLGAYLLRELVQSSSEIVAWSGTRPEDICGVKLCVVNLADADGVVSAFRQSRPSVVIHAAAVSSVAECYGEPSLARKVNVEATALLAELAGCSGARILYVSTDLVFDGDRGWYRETDQPSPLSVYGKTKAAAERLMQEKEDAVVARLSLLFGPTLLGRASFFNAQLVALREGRPLTLFADEWRTPLALSTAARALVALARSDYVGVLHVGGPERMSRLEMGQRLGRWLGADPSLLVAGSRERAAAPEPRPRDTSLDSSRWREHFTTESWPRFEDALDAMSAKP